MEAVNIVKYYPKRLYEEIPYSGKLQNILMEKSYKGLILDLSNNTGGNMIPMIGG